ncbi:MAG: transposase [Planctomycetaceae bacterium]|nr:transposase [Planctomycetaceae bacterium]
MHKVTAPEATMDFPIAELMDEDACYEKLVEVLHPDGLACPRCQARDALKVHRRHRAPVLDYRCDTCGRVFNAFTGSAFHKTHRRPSEILLILRGIAQGETTARLARELNRHRQHLLKLRHRLQDAALKAADPLPLDDRAVEADEMYQNAGEKRHPAYRPRRSAAPPRQPAAGAWQHGQRPAPGRGGGRARVGPVAAAGGRPGRRPDAPGVRPADDLADGAGVHRRMGGVRPPARSVPVARDGVPRRGRVGAG